MKLVSFGGPGDEQPGVLANDETVIPLRNLMLRRGFANADMITVLHQLSTLRPSIDELISAGSGALSLGEVRLGPPIPQPRAVLAVGANYAGHVAEDKEITRPELPDAPILFAKAASSVVGPYDAVHHPPETTMLDYEIELAVVIGRDGRRISRESALDHVAGYMISNDVTARDVFIGEAHKNPIYLQILRGKGYDTFCPTGPWLVTADEVPDPAGLELRLWVNDDLRQASRANQMIFDIPELVASASECLTLRTGDILLTGTPPGVGMSRQPPEFLKAGDELRLEITCLGVMRTPIVDEP